MFVWDLMLQEVLLVLSIAETLKWVYTQELTKRASVDLKLNLEDAILTYVCPMTEKDAAYVFFFLTFLFDCLFLQCSLTPSIQPSARVEILFISLLLATTDTASREAMHCLLEAYANNNAKAIWMLIVQGWCLASTLEKEFRISVCSHFCLLLFLQIISPFFFYISFRL
jgi:hypothetical protein